MKKEKHIVFTSGRGPVECALAVYGIQDRFRSYLKSENIEYKIKEKKTGNVSKSLESIVFEMSTDKIDKLTNWLGTIKWICQSPIRKNHKRKNWFIKVGMLTHEGHVKILEEEVRFSTFKASGPGGQHRNKVETAVRATHNKTGISVTASDGKSQHQNRKKAWQKLVEKINTLNQSSIEKMNLDKWMNQLEIERGNPVKVFVGEKFREQKR